jgi:hypothetical protein
VDDSIVLEDVDFFNAGNSIDAQPLQSALQPLVVSCGGLVHGLFFPEHEWITFFPQKVAHKKRFSSLQITTLRMQCMSFFGNHNSKTGKVKFVEKQENCNNKAAAKPHNTELPRQSTAASNPKNTRASTKEKREEQQKKKRGRPELHTF